jgi:putative sterol carrier protein
MPIYPNSEILQTTLNNLFHRVGQDPEAVKSVVSSKLILRLNVSAPAADVLINGRKNPPSISYGKTTLRPDLEISLSADALHQILLGELRLSSAVASKQLVVKGPIFKSFVFEDIFHSAQAIYPSLLKEMGPDGKSPE